VTNAHVVDGADEVIVTLDAAPAKIGADKRTADRCRKIEATNSAREAFPETLAV
jgi:S1-C subfamily serine protease